MPDTKISALTAGDPAQGTDQIPVARAGTNVKVTAASIAALSPSGTVTSVGLSGGTTGITVSGTNPITASGTFTLAGTLALANGGTGQTTKAAAFNALSPVTSTGDLIIGNGSNSNTRLAIGSNGYVLTSNGSTASWQAVSLTGTLGTSQGGTGTTTTPSNGQLLIGNGSGYTVANLTAGAGIAITNASGSITIASTGGPTINLLSVTTSSGGFSNNTPSSTYSRPLVGSTTSTPNVYGAFFFGDSVGGYNVSGPSVSQIDITDTASTLTSYLSGTDFSSAPATFIVHDFMVTCYGLSMYNAGMQAIFAASATAIPSPSFAPLDASNAFSLSNPQIAVSTSGSTYDNGGTRAIVVSNPAGYFIQFDSNDFTPASGFTISSIFISINGSSGSYFSGTDFTTSSPQNTANGEFRMSITPINGTLLTLLDNSFL